MTVVKCPRCGKETEYDGNEFRPFCDERCKLLDFGAWADGEYSVPAESVRRGDDEIAELERELRGRSE